MSEVRNYQDFLARHDSANPQFGARLRVFAREYRRHKDRLARPLRVLDVGCGKRAVLAKVVDPTDEYHGCDFHSQLDVPVATYVEIDLNKESLRARFEPPFDVVFCGEVLEHLFSPDALLRDLERLLALDGVIILSTPNLGYYVNRLLLLAGISPLYLENSAEAKLGRRWRRLGQGNPTEGHIRLFTYRALRDLVDRHRLEAVRIVPTLTWNFPLDRVVCRISRSLAPNNVFVLRRRR